jgi:hypothetical protein
VSNAAAMRFTLPVPLSPATRVRTGWAAFIKPIRASLARMGFSRPARPRPSTIDPPTIDHPIGRA